MLIFDSNRYARDPNSSAKQVEDAVKELGGEIMVSRLWAEQKLAFPINKQNKGTYWLMYFKIDTQEIAALNGKYRLNDTILRHMVTVIDERLIDTLVAHAQGVTLEGEPLDAESAGEEETVAAGSESEDA
jgi:small subunit ribosomal protein S6